jgi:hypothetical protein
VCKDAALGADPGSWPAATAVLARVLGNVFCGHCLLQLVAESDRTALTAGSREQVVLAMHRRAGTWRLQRGQGPGSSPQEVAAGQFSEGIFEDAHAVDVRYYQC